MNRSFDFGEAGGDVQAAELLARARRSAGGARILMPRPSPRLGEALGRPLAHVQVSRGRVGGAFQIWQVCD